MNAAQLLKILASGTVATLVMSAFAAMAPMMGMPPMDPAAMLAAPMGGSLALGWAAHLMIGNVLALACAPLVARLPGPLVVRCMAFAVAPWLVQQVMVMPMMGMGLFSSDVLLAGGSLMGHLVYGAVLGLGLGVGAPGAGAAAAT